VVAVCQKQLYERYCGPAAASVINLLLRRALNDPVFLRYRYRPHCPSHTTTTLTSTLTPEPSSTLTTTEDEATTSVENLTTTAELGGRRRQTGQLFDKSACVTFKNVSVVASLLAALTLAFAVE